jgi:hypothetical protein
VKRTLIAVVLVSCLLGLVMLGLSAAGGAQEVPTPVGQLGGPVSLTPPAEQETPPTPSPTSDASPESTVSGPEGCAIAPLPLDVVVAQLNGGAAAETSPESAPTGSPVASETTEAVSAALDIFVACVNAGDYLRIAAITTPAFFGEIVTGSGWETDELEANLSALHPRDPAQYMQILANGPVLMLSDSLATETVVLLEPASPLLGQVEAGVTFERVGDQWLVAGVTPVG